MENQCTQCKMQSYNQFLFSCHHSLCGMCLCRILFTDFLPQIQKNDNFVVKCKCNGSFQMSLQEIYDFVTGPRHDPPAQNGYNVCQEHNSRIKDIYCLDCKEYICSYCALNLRNSRHASHNYQLADDYNSSLKSNLPKTGLSSDLPQWDQLEKKFQDDYNNFLTLNICEFEELISTIQQIKEMFITEIKEQFDKQELIYKIARILFTQFQFQCDFNDKKNHSNSNTNTNHMILFKDQNGPNIFPQNIEIKYINKYHNEIKQIKEQLDLMIAGRRNLNSDIVIANSENSNSVSESDVIWENLERLWIKLSCKDAESCGKIDKKKCKEIISSQEFKSEELMLFEIFYKTEQYDNCGVILDKIKFDDQGSKLDSLGFGYKSKSQFEKALEYFLLALKTKQESPGHGPLETAVSFTNIGSVYDDKGMYDKAIEYHEKALRIRLATLGENNLDTSASCNYLGHGYKNRGQYDKALSYYQRALKIRLAILGENNATIAGSYNNIGLMYYNQGQYDKALEYHEKDLKIRLATVGENHADTALSYNNIGSVYYSQGIYDKALEYHEKALKIRLDTLGEVNSNTAASYNNIGLVYYETDNYDKALEYHEKALKIRLSTLGENHSNTAASYNNIANVYYGRDQYDLALDFHEKALKIRLKTLGENHLYTATSYNNIGLLYYDTGQYDKAKEFYEKALKIRLALLDENHPLVKQTKKKIISLENE